MKNCPVCGAQLEDTAAFCAQCGANQNAAPQQPQQPQQPQYVAPQPQYYAAPQQPAVDPYDHTADFDAQDISDNKVYCMLPYLMGIFGIIVALLASSSSKYVAFHVRQAVKLEVTSILLTLVMVVLFWTLIVPLAGAIALAVLAVVRIICFFQICSGKAKEPVIVRSLPFLK